MPHSSQERAHSRIVYTKPSIENVIPYAQYRKTQPEYQDSDNQPLNIPNDTIVLLGGGRNLLISPLDQNTAIAPVTTITNSEMLVDLFILNNCIIIWFNSANQGICIPYSSILYHAARKVYERDEGHRLELLLTVERDPIIDGIYSNLKSLMMTVGIQEQNQHTDQGQIQQQEESFNLFTLQSVELLLTPKYSMYERHYGSEIENLFTFMNFGLNRGDAMVNSCNEALAIALELSENYDSADDDSDMENGETEMCHTAACTTGMDVALKAYSNYNYQNAGNADDLNGDYDVSGTIH